MKTILIHVKNNEQMEKFREYEKVGYNDEEHYSREIKFMISEFKSNGWNVLLASLDNFNFETNTWDKVYSLADDEYKKVDIDYANENIDVIIVRVLGSVEGNFKNIKMYLEFLLKNYKGLALNNPKAMIKGMTKHYLCEIDPVKLGELGIKTINSRIFDRTVSLEELTKDYDNLENYIMKPVSGELSNSLSNLSKVDEEFLRNKEDKVLGWVVQPIMKEIYNGEYQMSFLNGEVIFAQRKEYTSKNNGIPNQKERILHKYNPSEKEISIMRSVIEYFKEKYDIEINICRTDFMKDDEGTPILLEFEMVNPGFFIGYMEENDKDIANITSKIRMYCEENIEK